MVPLGARILCQPIDVEDSFAGGRIQLLPDSLESLTYMQAEVLAVGPGEYNEEGEFQPVDPSIMPGVWIMHEPYKRIPVSDSDKRFMLHERDVIAMLT